MPVRRDINKILIIGSGPIVIGQACEFDYSGTQAVRVLKEEGFSVVLVNPNPATVMTTPGIADRIYMEPLTPEYLEEILKAEQPDALLPTMGGQTGLNLAIQLHELGMLEKYGIEVIGASIESIRLAEDRGEFKKIVKTIGLESPESILTKTMEGAQSFVDRVGLPAVIRPSYTLGGQGGSIAYTQEQLSVFVERALYESPVHEALIEESLIGWKEFEMEVMRDQADNAVVICSIENIDPMGVHTGDSITVAPIQTLSDREYQEMRTASIEVLRAIGVDCGGSNVQFAIKPDTGRMVIIEMNPRVSRSSALASKATGFPIARCAARLAVGYTLDEIVNDITGKTVSCFEPALDYCAIKVPRFEIEKFPQAYTELGTQMKSVGEALALGRTFIEALNKAIRAAEMGYEGISEMDIGYDGLDAMLDTLHPLRLFASYTVLSREGDRAFESLNKKTGYDYWFLYQLMEQVRLEDRIKKEELNEDLLLEAKRFGLSDRRIEQLQGRARGEVESLRHTMGMNAAFHFVDTCAGEFTADTPYFYSTYGEVDESTPAKKKSVVILASGPNRIGQGLEFDTCCTLASLAYRKKGVDTIIINSNPETVSTDFNISDRLYIEPLTVEHVNEILGREQVKDIVVQLGGQTPLNMARDLEERGAAVVGTKVQSIVDAEDRGLFAQLLRDLDLKQPNNRIAGTREKIFECADEIGYPVLLRPSFVLGGRSMYIAFAQKELEMYLQGNIQISAESPVLVDQFIEDAFEYDMDALCDGENVYIAGIMQHIEAAGVHSGDSACVFPPFKSEPAILDAMIDATICIARKIRVRGFINIQFAVKGHELFVLEVNPRASRTIPYLSKASGVNLIEAAVNIWLGTDLETQKLTTNGIGQGTCHTGWAVKEAVFSFERFHVIDPILGPEMKSTGEVIGTGESFGEAFAKAQSAAGTVLPVEGRVFVSVHDQDKRTVLPIIRDLVDMGFQIAATRGTAQFLFDEGIFAEVVLKIHEGRPNVLDHLQSGRIDLLINTPLGRFSQHGDEMIRIEAVRRRIPYTTTTSAAGAATEGIRYLLKKEVITRPLSSDTMMM